MRVIDGIVVVVVAVAVVLGSVVLSILGIRMPGRPEPRRREHEAGDAREQREHQAFERDLAAAREAARGVSDASTPLDAANRAADLDG